MVKIYFKRGVIMKIWIYGVCYNFFLGISVEKLLIYIFGILWLVKILNYNKCDIYVNKKFLSLI